MEGLQMPSAPSSPRSLAQSIQGGERSKSSGWEVEMVVALGGFQELKVKLQINLSKYIFFLAFLWRLMQRGEGPSHPAFPASLSPRLFMALLHKLGFFSLPFYFLFSSFSSLLLQIELFKCIVWQPQIPAFPSLSPLAAISFSPFCSCIFRIISRVVPVAFIEICTKKDPSSMPPFQPWQEIYGGRKTPVAGRFCQEKERKEGKEMWWKSKGCLELGSRKDPRR